MTDPVPPFDHSAHASDDESPLAGFPNQTRCIRSEEILQGENEVLILHGGALYRLRHTKSGKLILNK